MCSLAAYRNTPDEIRQQDVWAKLEEKYRSLNLENSDIEEKKVDWFIHDANRFFKEDSFEFKVESVGVYRNEELLNMACSVLKERLVQFIDDIDK